MENLTDAALKHRVEQFVPNGTTNIVEIHGLMCECSRRNDVAWEIRNDAQTAFHAIDKAHRGYTKAINGMNDVLKAIECANDPAIPRLLESAKWCLAGLSDLDQQKKQAMDAHERRFNRAEADIKEYSRLRDVAYDKFKKTQGM